MYSLKLENEFNSQIEITHNENNWQITSITGLNPPAAIISTSAIPNFDGERFNSSRLDKRNIVISFVINGNVEKNLMTLNSIIFPKRYIKVYYKNSLKNLYIDGYVESFEYDKFSAKCACQLSIICTDPYWKDAEVSSILLSQLISLFEFPFSIPKEGIALSEIIDTQSYSVMNYGSIETGVQFIIEARANVVEPTIMNLSTQESMTIRTHLNTGDRLLISTVKGSKYVKMDCNCVESNLINDLINDSKWIKLVPGENRFTYSAAYGPENIDLIIKHRNLYGGV